MVNEEYQLPELPYGYDELEPVISRSIMELHHQKHHKTYLLNLNKALIAQKEAFDRKDLATAISYQPQISFNGGGHLNHSIFWETLAPPSKGGGVIIKGPLLSKIEENFGSLEALIEKMSTKTIAIQGSGWGWLGYHQERKLLAIATTFNQDILALQGLYPLFGIDVWEHAYYLDYQNQRASYVNQIWKVCNWKAIEERFLKIVG